MIVKGVLVQVIIIIFIISASHYSRLANIDIRVYMSAIRKERRICMVFIYGEYALSKLWLL